MGDAVDERDVAARFDGQVEVGHHGGLGDAGVDDDEGAGLAARAQFFKPLAEDGMVVGDVGTDQNDNVGVLHVGVGARGAVAAEGELVASDGAGHAEGGIAVAVASGEAELNQLAEGVELLGEELTGADDSERVFAVALLDGGKVFDEGVESFVPRDRNEVAVLAQERLPGAAGVVEDVMLAETLRAELAKVDGVVGVAANGDGLAVLDADQHAAANGAVAAGGLDPGVGDAGGGDVSEAGVVLVGVVGLAGVDAEEAAEFRKEGHA